MKRNEILDRIGIVPPPAARVRLMVDTDTKNEADDQYAIMHHLLTPMFDLRGIIAEHFEQKAGYTGQSMEASYREIETVLSLAEIDDVPVFRGCVSPLRSMRDTPDSEAVRRGFVDYMRITAGFYVVQSLLAPIPKIIRAIGNPVQATRILMIVSIGNVFCDLLLSERDSVGGNPCGFIMQEYRKPFIHTHEQYLLHDPHDIRKT